MPVVLATVHLVVTGSTGIQTLVLWSQVYASLLGKMGLESEPLRARGCPAVQSQELLL
jgi:hypothetical protein